MRESSQVHGGGVDGRHGHGPAWPRERPPTPVRSGMYEHRSERMLGRAEFLVRQGRHLAIASGLILIALGIGVVGYHAIEGMRWIDALYMASNILTGMGPTTDIKSDAGKLFGSAYALFSGVVFLTAASVLLAPGLHRLLHKLHLDFEAED